MNFKIIPFISILLLSLFLHPTSSNAESVKSTVNTQFSMFWLLKDAEIEQPKLLESQFSELKKAGYTSLYVMLRASRYSIFDPEVIAAAKRVSEMCSQSNIKFIFGLDPRFGASYITRKTGFGAQHLLTAPNYLTSMSSDSIKKSTDIERYGLNEQKLIQGSYNLKYNYAVRRETHILTDVSLSSIPVGVDKVFAYQRKDGKVITGSIRDITSGHHLFSNRSQFYVEVFGKVELPEGEWYVTAFPRFMTNMYAYDSKEQQQIFEGLIGEYKKQDVKLDGLVWDEPGYYVEFGKYVVSEQIYTDFQQKYGYDLKSKLYALTLKLDDNSQIKVRNDYFTLLTDYVIGGEKRIRDIGKSLYGTMRMGIHPTWHDVISEDKFHGISDYWRSIEAVDGGYTDGGNYEEYMTSSVEKRFAAVSYMVTAKGLARYSETKKAHFNQWGIKFGNDVTSYWNDLMAAFSNEWINHCYGYTGVLGKDFLLNNTKSENLDMLSNGGSRGIFGPGYPNHESWAVLPELVAKCKKVDELTSYNLPLGESVIIYPNTTLLSTWAADGIGMERRIVELIGSMPAMGLQTDVIGSSLLEKAEVVKGKLVVRGHVYNAVFLPYNKILSDKSIQVLQKLIAQKGLVYFGGTVPQMDLNGKPIDLKVQPSFSLSGDIQKTMAEIMQLNVPSSCSQLKGAYLNLIPSAVGKIFYLTVMPIDPDVSVSGIVIIKGQKVEIKPTKSLAIYQIQKGFKPKSMMQN